MELVLIQQSLGRQIGFKSIFRPLLFLRPDDRERGGEEARFELASAGEGNGLRLGPAALEAVAFRDATP